MSFKATYGAVVVELSSTYAFVKLSRYEAFVSFQRDSGPA